MIQSETGERVVIRGWKTQSARKSEEEEAKGPEPPILLTLVMYNGPPGESGENMWAKLLRGNGMHMQEPWCLDTWETYNNIHMYPQMQGTAKAKEAKANNVQ